MWLISPAAQQKQGEGPPMVPGGVSSWAVEGTESELVAEGTGQTGTDGSKSL